MLERAWRMLALAVVAGAVLLANYDPAVSGFLTSRRVADSRSPKVRSRPSCSQEASRSWPCWRLSG
jgi:hypothetical protein